MHLHKIDTEAERVRDTETPRLRHMETQRERNIHLSLERCVHGVLDVCMPSEPDGYCDCQHARSQNGPAEICIYGHIPIY